MAEYMYQIHSDNMTLRPLLTRKPNAEKALQEASVFSEFVSKNPEIALESDKWSTGKELVDLERKLAKIVTDNRVEGQLRHKALDAMDTLYGQAHTTLSYRQRGIIKELILEAKDYYT